MSQDRHRERVRRLFQLFRLYERLDETSKARTQSRRTSQLSILVLRQLAHEYWRAFFGDSLDEPAHQRHVLAWSRHNLARLHEARLIPTESHKALDAQIQLELEALLEGDARYDFSKDGGDDQTAEALRRLYLLQSLNVRIEDAAHRGQVSWLLQEAIRKDLGRRARTLFLSVLGEDAVPAIDEDTQLAAALRRYRSLGLIEPIECERLLELLAPAAGSCSGDEAPDSESDALKALGLEQEPEDSTGTHEQTSDVAEALENLKSVPGAGADFIQRRDDAVTAVTRAVSAMAQRQRALELQIASLARRLGTDPGAFMVPGAAPCVTTPAAAPSTESPSTVETAPPAPGSTAQGAGTGAAAPTQEEVSSTAPQGTGIVWDDGDSSWADEFAQSVQGSLGTTADSAPTLAADLAPAQPEATGPSASTLDPTAPTQPSIPRPPPTKAPHRPSPPTATPSRPRHGPSTPPPRSTAPAGPSLMESLMATLLEELGVNWLLFTGVLMVVASGVLLAVKNWKEMGPALQYLFILGITSGFYGMAIGTHQVMKLKRTPLALFSVVLLLTPLDFVAMDVLQLPQGGGLPGPTGPALCLSGALVLAGMVAHGCRTVLDLPWLTFAPTLIGTCVTYMLIAWTVPVGTSEWTRLGLLVGAAFVSRWRTRADLAELESRGVVWLALASVSIATVATGIRLGTDTLTVGLTAAAASLVWMETGVGLARLVRGPLQNSAPSRWGLILRIGALVALAGSCVALFPQPRHNPIGLLVLAYASRALYTSFILQRSNLEFFLLVPAPGVLLALLPFAHRSLESLWLDPLLATLKGTWAHAPREAIYALPLVLVGPFYAYLAERLKRRQMTNSFTMLHVLGSIVGAAAFFVTASAPWAGLVAGVASVLLWGPLYVVSDVRHARAFVAAGVLDVCIQIIRLIDAPPWVWLTALVGFALAILEVHLRSTRPGASADAEQALLDRTLGDVMLNVAYAMAGIGVFAYMTLLAMGSVTRPGGWPYDIPLLMLVAFYIRSLWAHVGRTVGLMPTLLMLVECLVVLDRLNVWNRVTAGYLFALGALLPTLVARMLTGPEAQDLMERTGPAGLADPHARNALASAYSGLAFVLCGLAFLAPPVFSWYGSGKYLLLACVSAMMARARIESAGMTVLSLAMAVHAPFLGNLDQPSSCAALQLTDLILGAAMLVYSRTDQGPLRPVIHSAGQVFQSISLVFLLMPIVSVRSHETVWTLLGCTLALAQCLYLWFEAHASQTEDLVWAGEAVLGAIYARLLFDGWLPRTLAMGIVVIAVSFVLLVLQERAFNRAPWGIYRRPSQWTCLLLPVAAMLRGFSYGGGDGGAVVLLCGLFYHIAAIRLSNTDVLPLALLLYNAGSLMLPPGPDFLDNARYLIPLGASLLMYAHTPGTRLTREQVGTCRIAGLLCIFGEPLPWALLSTQGDAAFIMVILLSLFIAALGMLVRVRLYLGAGTALLVVTVLGFVLKQVLHSTHLGLFSMLGLGVLLILLGATFEQMRDRLRAWMGAIQGRLAGWE